MENKPQKNEVDSLEPTTEKQVQKESSEKTNTNHSSQTTTTDFSNDEKNKPSEKNISNEDLDTNNVVKFNNENDKMESSIEISKKQDLQFDEEITYSKDEIEELSKVYINTLPVIEDKQVLNGKVVRITDKVVVVDINFKSDGVINSSEFKYLSLIHI